MPRPLGRGSRPSVAVICSPGSDDGAPAPRRPARETEVCASGCSAKSPASSSSPTSRSPSARTAVRAGDFYARWFPKLAWDPGTVPSAYAEFDDLTTHLRFVERSSRRSPVMSAACVRVRMLIDDGAAHATEAAALRVLREFRDHGPSPEEVDDGCEGGEA